MKNQLARAACAAVTLSLFALAGCDQTDPLLRPYVWVPSDVNVHNIAAQAVDPADLLHGRETQKRRAVQESDAVDHLWAGHPAPLLGSGGGGGGAAPAAAPPSGG